MLNDKLNEEFGEYIFSTADEHIDYVEQFIGNSPELKYNYYNFKVDGKFTFVVDVEENYTNMYMYQLFEALHKTLNSNKDAVDSLYLKNMARNALINSYETDEIIPVLENKTFQDQWKEIKKQKGLEALDTKPPLAICEQIFNSTKYYPSIFELRLLSDFVGVNIVLFTRNTKSNTKEKGDEVKRKTRIEYIDNRVSQNIFIYHKYDHKGIRHFYELVVVDQERKKYIFNATDMKSVMFEVKQKNMLYEIDVSEADLALAETTENL
jgi:hypothetical protein